MKVGIVGLGRRMAFVARLLRKARPDVDFVAWADPGPAGLADMEAAGVAMGRGYGDPAAMLAAERFDLLLIGSPNHLHLDHLRLGLGHDQKIFTEKPVVTTEEDTYTLLEWLAGADADRVMIGLVLRYSPLYRDLVAQREAGRLGPIASIEAAETIEPAHGAFFMRDWRRRNAFSGGLLLEKCCHDLDLYQGLVGARPIRVASFGSRRSFRPEWRDDNGLGVYQRKPGGWQADTRVFDGDGDIVDNQVALLQFPDGVNMTFHLNINTPDEYRRFCIVGARGMAEGDFVRRYLRVHDAKTGAALLDRQYETDPGDPHYGADQKMVADLLAHMHDGAALPVSIHDGLAAGLTAIKTDEARRTGQVIDLTETWQRFDAARTGGRRAG